MFFFWVALSIRRGGGGNQKKASVSCTQEREQGRLSSPSGEEGAIMSHDSERVGRSCGSCGTLRFSALAALLHPLLLTPMKWWLKEGKDQHTADGRWGGESKSPPALPFWVELCLTCAAAHFPKDLSGQNEHSGTSRV